MPILPIVLGILGLAAIYVLRRRADQAGAAGPLPELPPLPDAPPLPAGWRPQRFVPHSAEAKALFRQAAERYGLPAEWADERELHDIVKKESGGWVGVPNYTYSKRYGASQDYQEDRNKWPLVWQSLREGKFIGARIKSGPQKGKFSSATGLGQLTVTNARMLMKSRTPMQPDAAGGYGDPVKEAAGMMRYIQWRYGDPKKAWAQYGKHGEGY